MNSSQIRLADLEQRTPATDWEIVTVDFPNADTDVEVTTGLHPSDPELIEYQVLNASGPPLVFHDTSASRIAWSSGLIRLRSAVAGLKANILLSIAARDRTKLDGGSKTIAASLLSLPANLASKATDFGTQEFRGLHLRTHSDKDNSQNTKIMLIHADEIVMDDGTRLSNWDNLTADISGAGAGGLDSGSEAPSAWYEIYAIAKDDGTRNLLFHRAKNYKNDTSFTTGTDAQRTLRLATSTATDKLAQGIQFATAGLVQSVVVKLDRVGTPAGRFWFTIEADSAGNPSGTPLATSEKLDAALLTIGTEQRITVIFRTPATVAASTQYHLVLQGDFTKSDTNAMAWRGVVAGGYANGSAKQFNGTAWSAATGVADFGFEAFVTVNDTAVTYPTGYTKKAKIGYVYNNSSSDFLTFIQFDHTVHPLNAGASVSSTGNAFGTLIDMSAEIPPGLIRWWMLAVNSGVGNVTSVGGVPDGYSTPFSARAYGTVTLVAGTANQYYHGHDVITEFQGLYLAASAGTSTFYRSGWEWFQ